MMTVSFTDLIQVAAFKLNQADISKALCINKDKPALKCDGKCFLNKTLAASKEDKQEKPIPPPDEKSPLVLNVDMSFTELAILANKKGNIFHYIFPHSLPVHDVIPHPPQMIV